MNQPIHRSIARFPVVLLSTICLLLAANGSAAAESADAPARPRVDWNSADEIRWDPETRQFVVVGESAESAAQADSSDAQSEDADSSEGTPGQPPRVPQQPVSWNTLDSIRWDPETRTFVTTERAATPANGGQETFDTRNYRLSVRDQIELQVFDEPDLSLTQRIDGSGQVRIPHLGTHEIAGMTVRQAEDYIEKLFVENRILRNPIVTIRVADYAPREVAVLGAVGNPGTQEFPIERNQLDIVEVISRAGGFTGIARSDAVSVTRIDESGEERTFTVDVESMITGSQRQDRNRFQVQPGDVIWVRERVF